MQRIDVPKFEKMMAAVIPTSSDLWFYCWFWNISTYHDCEQSLSRNIRAECFKFTHVSISHINVFARMIWISITCRDNIYCWFLARCSIMRSGLHETLMLHGMKCDIIFALSIRFCSKVYYWFVDFLGISVFSRRRLLNPLNLWMYFHTIFFRMLVSLNLSL